MDALDNDPKIHSQKCILREQVYVSNLTACSGLDYIGTIPSIKPDTWITFTIFGHVHNI